MSKPTTYDAALVTDLLASGEFEVLSLAAGLTREEIAQAVGVSEATISRWFNGKRTPSRNDALRLAELLTLTAISPPGGQEGAMEGVHS